MSKCQPWMLAYVSATLLSTLLLPMGQGMWLRMSPVTLPFHVKHQIVDRHSTYLRGLTVAASSKFR